MATAKAGRYNELLLSSVGDLLPNTSVTVRIANTTTAATLYTDENKGTTAANPTTTDSFGNLGFWADFDSHYDLFVNGTTIQDVLVTPSAAALAGSFERQGVLANDPVLFVSKSALASDANNGLSVGTAKATIQAAINAIPGGAKGKVSVLPGDYEGNYSLSTADSAYAALLHTKNKVTIEAAAGLGSVTVKLQNSATTTATNRYLCLNSALSGGDTDCRLVDLLFDGNAANQTLLGHGVGFIRATRPVCERVWVQNCRGTSGTSPNETFHFEFQLSSNFAAIGCWAVGTAGSTATGFSANDSTNGTFDRCTAYGMSVAHGFTHNTCNNLTYVACRSYDNAGIGFNSEASHTVSYIGCVSGGRAGRYSYPFPDVDNGDPLGNTGNGWVLNGTLNFELLGCSSIGNGDNGVFFERSDFRTVTDGVATNGSVTVTSATAAFTSADLGSQIVDTVNYVVEGSVIIKINSATSVDVDRPASQSSGSLNLTILRSSSGRVVGGAYSKNATLGFSFAAHGNKVVTISGAPELLDNTTGQVYNPTVGVHRLPGRASGSPGPPAVPASDVYVANPYSCTAVVYLIGGTYTSVYLDDNIDFGTPRTFTLRPNQRVAITHSAAPTWQWELIQ